MTVISGISCQRYFYMPNIQNVPGFREKNEFKIQFGMGVNDWVKTQELQAAYAITDHIAVMANLINAQASGGYGHGNFMEGAAGYYLPVQNRCSFEIYGGYGFGSVYNNQNDQKNQIYPLSVELQRYFIQPSFTYRNNWFEVSIADRIGGVVFYNPQMNGTAPMDNDWLTLNSTKNKFFDVSEPSLTIRLGWKYIKFQLQYCTSFNSIPVRTLKDNLSLSIIIFVSPLFEKKETLQEK